MSEAAIAPARHPLIRAFASMVQDLLSTIVFVVILSFTNNVTVAIGVGIAIGLAEVGFEMARGRPVHRMQWLSMFLVLVFGGATLLTGNPVFAKVKPALIYAAVAIVLLSPGWMNRYAPTSVRGVDLSGLNRMFGFVWAGMFGLLALAFFALALLASPATFALFVLVVPMSAKFAMIGVQYGVTRRMVRRRLPG